MDNPDISLRSVFYPLDVREDDPTQCVKYWSNGYIKPQTQSVIGRPTDITNGSTATPTGNSYVFQPGHLGLIAVKSPTVTRINSTDSLSDGFMRWTMINWWTSQNPSDGLVRCWFSDLLTGENPAYQIGDCEVDVTARVRVNFNGETTTNTNFRVGIVPRHARFYPDTGEFDNGGGAFFLASRVSSNWQIYNIRTVNGANSTKITNTSVPWNQWATLRVWVSKYGEWIRYYINGELVATITDFADGRYMHGLGADRTNTGLMCGLFFRKDDLYTTTNHPHADIDFVSIKMFPNRTGVAATEDVIPNTISYMPIGYDTVDLLYTYAQHQITGIDRPIRVKAEYLLPGVGLYADQQNVPFTDGEPAWSSSASPLDEGFMDVPHGTAFVVSPNQYLAFGYDGVVGGANGAPSTFTVTLKEYDTGTIIAQFDCITSAGMTGGGPGPL